MNPEDFNNMSKEEFIEWLYTNRSFFVEDLFMDDIMDLGAIVYDDDIYESKPPGSDHVQVYAKGIGVWMCFTN